MKITFTETGGLLGKTKKAEINADISEKEYKELIKKVSVKRGNKMIKPKDAFQYFLSSDADHKKVAISISNIPNSYNDVFDELFKNLKVI